MYNSCAVFIYYDVYFDICSLICIFVYGKLE